MLQTDKLKSYCGNHIFQENPTQGVELPPEDVSTREVSNAYSNYNISMRTGIERLTIAPIIYRYRPSDKK
jgi:hypothetical protein